MIIQAGIQEVIGCASKPLPEHWIDGCNLGATLLLEAGVRIREISPEGIIKWPTRTEK